MGLKVTYSSHFKTFSNLLNVKTEKNIFDCFLSFVTMNYYGEIAGLELQVGQRQQ